MATVESNRSRHALEVLRCMRAHQAIAELGDGHRTQHSRYRLRSFTSRDAIGIPSGSSTLTL
ncbi:MAG TPA: hypothetical protein VGQ10_05910 [Vicinamibacterales bacterium]|nr:hypothetical protein [Vicinamibacterales bacterium]